jgi:hypothetical protein
MELHGAIYTLDRTLTKFSGKKFKKRLPSTKNSSEIYRALVLMCPARTSVCAARRANPPHEAFLLTEAARGGGVRRKQLKCLKQLPTERGAREERKDLLGYEFA